jgi:hypothetical protein
MKEFTSAIEESEQGLEAPLEFKIDGRVVRAYRPTDGQFAMVMATLGRHTSMSTKVAGIIDFFVGIMDEQSHQYVVDRLMSRDNQLGFDKVQEIIEWMVEEWSARPTPSPSGSTRSPKSGGQKSKHTTRQSTSLESAHAAS